MKTQNVIQASANVVRLVNLKKGDVFKIVKADDYGSGITFNIVTNIYNDGEKAFIEVVEYTKSYNSVDAKITVISGEKDVSMFHADVQEVEEYFAGALKQIKEGIEEKKMELQKTIEAYGKAKEFVAGELTKKIQSAEFKEQTQEEYMAEKALKEAKLKELNS